jgi:hypothetical protein
MTVGPDVLQIWHVMRQKKLESKKKTSGSALSSAGKKHCACLCDIRRTAVDAMLAAAYGVMDASLT